jgi:hypothetical protein
LVLTNHLLLLSELDQTVSFLWLSSKLAIECKCIYPPANDLAAMMSNSAVPAASLSPAAQASPTAPDAPTPLAAIEPLVVLS